MHGLSARVALCMIALASISDPAVADSTRDAVKARLVEASLRLQLVFDKDQKPVLQYFVDDRKEAPREFDAGLVFVADGSIAVTFPRFNPLEVQITAAIAETDDPAHAALTQLLASLTAVGGILRPDLAKKFEAAIARATPETVATAEACRPYRDAQINLRALVAALFPLNLSANALRTEIGRWKKDIADQGQPGVVATIGGLADLHKSAVAASTVGKAEVEKFERAVLAALENSSWPSETCRADTLAVYDLARLADPAERLRELEAVVASIKKLGEMLTPFAGSKDWIEDGAQKLRTWVVVRVKADEAKSKQIAIKAGTVGYLVADDSGVTSKTTAETSAAFSLRQHRRLIPELGVGAILADLRRPKYVVGKDSAGATVVARGASEDVPLGAAVMANLVFRTDLDIGAPMLQLGGLPSKDAPGIFGGVGFRFFARFGVGVGMVRWWAKDLREDPNDPTLLTVGKPVASQKDIEDKLSWVGRNNFYLTLQYSF